MSEPLKFSICGPWPLELPTAQTSVGEMAASVWAKNVGSGRGGPGRAVEVQDLRPGRGRSSGNPHGPDIIGVVGRNTKEVVVVEAEGGGGYSVQVLPSKCSIRLPLVLPFVRLVPWPTAQMSLAEMAVTAFRNPLTVLGLWTTLHLVPSKCSMRPPVVPESALPPPTAQTLVGDTTATPLSVPPPESAPQREGFFGIGVGGCWGGLP